MNKIKIWLCFCLPLLFCTGCFDSRDPEDRAYIITLGVDIAETGYTFSFVPALTETNSEEAFSITSNTIANAIVQLNRENSKKIDLGQLKMVIFSKNIFQDEKTLMALLDELERNQEISEKIMILATEDTAKEVLDQLVKEEKGLYLWDFYHNTKERIAMIQNVDFIHFMSSLKGQNGSVILPKIAVLDDKIEIGGGMVLLEYVYQFSLNEREEKGYLLLQEEASGAVFECLQDEIYIPFEILKNSIYYDIFYEGEQLKMLISCEGVVDLLGNLEKEVFNTDYKKELENAFEELIKTELHHTINIAKEQKAEKAFGFYLPLKRAGIEIMEELFTNLEIEIETSFTIRDTGKIR